MPFQNLVLRITSSISCDRLGAGFALIDDLNLLALPGKGRDKARNQLDAVVS